MNELTINIIGIVFNDNSQIAIEVKESLANCLKKDAKIWTTDLNTVEKSGVILDDTDLLIVIGGDGTILRIDGMAAPLKVPVLGINAGKLGYLAELDEKESFNSLYEKLITNSWLDHRMMIEASIIQNNSKNSQKLLALNEIVLASSKIAKLLRIKISIDQMKLGEYACDGMIVSTPTGSTAFSLSSGGPIVSPQAKVMVISPLAPHLGLPNSFVLSDNSIIELEVLSDENFLGLSADGYLELAVNINSKIELRKSSVYASFIRFNSPEYFFKRVNNKLM